MRAFFDFLVKYRFREYRTQKVCRMWTYFFFLYFTRSTRFKVRKYTLSMRVCKPIKKALSPYLKKHVSFLNIFFRLKGRRCRLFIFFFKHDRVGVEKMRPKAHNYKKKTIDARTNDRNTKVSIKAKPIKVVLKMFSTSSGFLATAIL